jgi:DNA-binding HxlR family transcriptional regulator
MQVSENAVVQFERPTVDSVERTLDQVGDKWTFLILREAFFGVRRFDGIQRNTGATANIVSDRLKKLVGFGLFAKRQYSERPPRFEYVLTEKGADLYNAVVLLMKWGDRWLMDCDRPPLTLIHKSCGAHSSPELVCNVCHAPIHARDMDWQPGGSA